MKQLRPDLQPQSRPDPETVTLRLLSTTDVHGHLTGYDFFADRPDPCVGLTRTATLIDEARAEAANVLLFDSGDFLQGSAITDLAAEPRRRGLHPVILAMNALGYDAAALGNHDFNHGLRVLRRAMEQARFPVLCANIRVRGLTLEPAALLSRTVVDAAGIAHPLSVGVFGVAPVQIITWDRQILPADAAAEDMVAASRTQIAALRAAGADLVIGLCHTGVGDEGSPSGPEHLAHRIAGLPGIDAVLAGHSHQTLPLPGAGPVESAGCPALVVAGSQGGWLGVVDLDLRRTTSGWSVVRSRSTLRPVSHPDRAPVAEAPALSAMLAPVQAVTRRRIRQTVGETARTLHSYFALALPSLTEAIVAEAKIAYTRRHLAGTPAAALPILAATSPFKSGGPAGPRYFTDIPPGPLTLRSVADLYIYPNAICAVHATGADLRLWIERAAGQFRQIAPGEQDAILLDPEFPSHGFDILHGLTYHLDLSRPARFRVDGSLAEPGAWRVADLRHAGRPVRDADRFIVASNAYRAGGGGGYPVMTPDRVALQTTERVRDILHRYLESGCCATTCAPRVFRFAPMDRPTTALLRTGPGAAANQDEARAQGLELAGETPDGYLLFRLSL